MSEFWNAFFLLLIWVPIIILWVAAVLDIFKRHDIGGLGKALWILGVLIFPILGALIYLVIRPPGTTAREEATRAEQGGNLAHTGSTQDLAVLADLHDRGKLTDEEFRMEKSKRLQGAVDPHAASVREQRGGQIR